MNVIGLVAGSEVNTSFSMAVVPRNCHNAVKSPSCLVLPVSSLLLLSPLGTGHIDSWSQLPAVDGVLLGFGGRTCSRPITGDRSKLVFMKVSRGNILV